MKLVWIFLACALVLGTQAKVPSGYELVCDEPGKNMTHQQSHQKETKIGTSASKSKSEDNPSSSTPQEPVYVTQKPSAPQTYDSDKPLSSSSEVLKNYLTGFASSFIFLAFM
jgi:hypothetical protein